MYGVVETTKIIQGDCFDFVSEVDVENGALVVKGELADDERLIYNCDFPAAADLEAAVVYLVAHPAWLYDESRAVNQNEENYTNLAGKPFRVYSLRPNSRFKLTDYSISPINGSTPLAKGQYVKLQADTGKMIASVAKPEGVAFVGKVLAVDETGFPFAIGSAGAPISGDSGNQYGSALDTRMRMVLVEVLANSSVVTSEGP